MTASDRTLADRASASAAVSRRTALTLGGATASVVALAACAPGASTPPAAEAPPAEPTAVGSLADLPVGGTASAELGSTPILLSRPAEGEVKAFSAICTHQQCVVSADFGCPCHGSTFDASTGEPTEGPAMQPLPEYQVTLDGDTILVSA
ncbi:Rieske (2Fe-2S) protein [Lysobacter korlensis]|uniref:Rieske (2Fe-2S) protein n=1 Tax=Lysobacter korlensis TaxID=553636 RepID=A0ABV6RN42_9GAMM